MTGDEYVALLTERQAAYIAEHPPRVPWAKPLLEWFIRDGDEELFTPPPDPEQPKPQRTPRRYRSSESLRAERDRLSAQRNRLGRPMSNDPATSHVGAKLALKNARRMDREVRRYVELDERIKHLEHRIVLAEAREGR